MGGGLICKTLYPTSKFMSTVHNWLKFPSCDPKSQRAKFGIRCWLLYGLDLSLYPLYLNTTMSIIDCISLIPVTTLSLYHMQPNHYDRWREHEKINLKEEIPLLGTFISHCWIQMEAPCIPIPYQSLMTHNLLPLPSTPSSRPSPSSTCLAENKRIAFNQLSVLHLPATAQVWRDQKALLHLHICGGPTNTVAGRCSKAVSW